MFVAEAIHQGGLDNYYQFRDALGEKAAEYSDNFVGYDLDEVQQAFVRAEPSGLKTARLSVQGISCAACAWLIESHLHKQPAVESVRVNATSRTCLLRWDEKKQPLSELMAALTRIGYRPQPDRQQDADATRRREAQQYMMRLGVAGIGMMQVGMVAVALYAGGIQGMESHWQSFFRWVSLVIATPVVVFSAQPFFLSAWRAVRARHLNMDVSVSLAIGLAYGASAWATVYQTGEVYFDSVSMFTFFLLLGRFLEMRARHNSAFARQDLQQLLPLTAARVKDNAHDLVPLAAIGLGDRLWVNAGDVIPSDGVLISPQAQIDESLLTGESIPQQKKMADELVAGTLNTDTALVMEVTATGDHTQLSAIERMVDQASLEKPRQVALADRIAGRFVAVVLIIALVVAWGWWQVDPGKALWVVLSVLVVTCPCALSLATPAALTAGVNRARKLGLLITGAQSLEALAKVDVVAFDKTGTLTEGRLRVTQLSAVVPEQAHNIDYWVGVITALEKFSQHPIAGAFSQSEKAPDATEVEVVEGEGVAGVVDGRQYRFGKLEFADKSYGYSQPEQEGMWQLLSSDHQGKFTPLMWVCLNDNLRTSSAQCVMRLKDSKQQVSTALLSGDRPAQVERIAKVLGITESVPQARPADKLTWVQNQQRSGHRVLMVGDGINDVPVLSAADVSMAMGSATRLAQSKADCVLLHSNLLAIPDGLALARRVQAIVRQNLSWALLYNVVALPAAAAGILPPWLAAIGMSFSSLIVVLNATRV